MAQPGSSEALANAAVSYDPEYCTQRQAQTLFQRLYTELEWQQLPITLFGRKLLQPRLIAWNSDNNIAYSYSGIKLNPQTWHPLLADLRERLQDDLGRPFNSVLANLYRDGRDSMGWHADDEPELGSEPLIASLSLGAERRFLLRRKDDHQNKAEWLLTPGSLLLMGGECQRYWQHSVPKSAPVQQARINLTFRYILV